MIHHRDTEDTEVGFFVLKFFRRYRMNIDNLTGQIIGAAIEVHKALGPKKVDDVIKISVPSVPLW